MKIENTIVASGLTKSFGKNIAVNDVSFQLKKGEVLGFLGPNGQESHNDEDAYGQSCSNKW